MIEEYLTTNDHTGTYYPDKYYINTNLGGAMRSERVVGRLRFYLTWLWWRITERGFVKDKQFHVLREIVAERSGEDA